MNKKPTITYAIIGINVTIFLIMMIVDHTLSYTTLVDFGAKVNFRIADYKLWHLVTPIFLHGSFEHLAMNIISLFIFGQQIELMLGSVKYTLTYIVIGILATMGSFIFSNTLSIGASGVIYGFMGLFLYLFFTNKERYLQIFGKDILILIIINIVFTFLSPGIDIAGHLVGLASGFALFALMFRLDKRFTIAGTLIIALIISGFGVSMNQYRYSEHYYQAKATYLHQKDMQHELNQLEQEYQQRHSIAD